MRRKTLALVIFGAAALTISACAGPSASDTTTAVADVAATEGPLPSAPSQQAEISYAWEQPDGLLSVTATSESVTLYVNAPESPADLVTTEASEAMFTQLREATPGIFTAPSSPGQCENSGTVFVQVVDGSDEYTREWSTCTQLGSLAIQEAELWIAPAVNTALTKTAEAQLVEQLTEPSKPPAGEQEQ